MKKGLFIIGLLSILVLSACGVSKPVGSGEPKVIKIGVIIPLSGDVGAYGQDMEKILSYELTKVNEKAKQSNVEFKLVYEDGKCAGNDSATAIQKLTDMDGIKLIVGGACSSETLAAAPIAQSKGVVIVSPLSSNPEVENQGEYVFSLSYRDDLVGKSIAQELAKYTKVALVSEQNDFNVGLQKVVLGELKNNANVQVVADEVFEKGATDFRNILEKIAKAEPEVVFLNPNPGSTAENLLKQITEIPEWKNFKLVSQYAYLPDGSRAQAADIAEGMIVIDAPTMVSPQLEKEMSDIELAANGKIETIGTYYTASTIDAFNLLAESALKNGDDPMAVKNDLRSGKFKGMLGEIYFGEDNFVQNIPTAAFVVENGKAVAK